MATSRTSRTISSFVCQACQRRAAPQIQRRLFTSTPSARADEQAPATESPSLSTTNTPSAPALKTSFSDLSSKVDGRSRNSRSKYISVLDGNDDASSNSLLSQIDTQTEGPHRLYVYAHKHNTHLTLVQHPRPAYLTAGSGITSTKAGTAEADKMVDVIMSLSAGNLGFKKAGRSSFDAAFQLTGYFFKQIQERGMLRDIEKLEVILRGFGAGREAVTKIILGPEGKNIRGKITAVLDGTRLKFGGTRSRKPRRLG